MPKPEEELNVEEEIIEEDHEDEELNEEETEEYELGEDGEPMLDDDGNPIKKEQPPLEPWQETEGEKDGKVPVQTHIRMKQRLKTKVSDQNDEISNLKAEIEELKKRGTVKTANVIDLPKKPKREDFDDDDLYEAAIDEWRDERDDARLQNLEREREVKGRQRQAIDNLNKSVDAHYERAETLVKESAINPEVYENADKTVREAIEAISPKKGDLITDQLISFTGEGSEKVFYYLGRNKTALAELKGILAEDQSGIKAAVYIGQLKERLTNPKKPTSQARQPSPNPKGDLPKGGNKKITALKKKYKEAHKKGEIQTAYNIKQEAKKAGADTSKWHKEI